MWIQTKTKVLIGSHPFKRKRICQEPVKNRVCWDEKGAYMAILDPKLKKSIATKKIPNYILISIINFLTSVK